MNGIERVQARMAAIEAQIQARLTPPRPPGLGAAGPLGAGSAAGTGSAGGQPAGFQDLLDKAMGDLEDNASTMGRLSSLLGDPTGRPTPAERKAPGTYGPIEAPAALAAHGNGRIPTGLLAEIGVGSHRLHAPAADAFRQLRDAARADGVDIGVTDSYRSYEAQVDLAERKGLHSHGGLAAVPGTSAHGWGLALDLDLDSRAQGWMREHAWEYGFAEDTPREPWHWTYRPA